MVRDYHGYFQGYNVQAVTSSDQIIVAAEVTRAATDMHELQPMIEATNRNLEAAHCGPPRGRIPAGLSVRERMDRKLATQRGRRLYEQRRWMIEPVFGDIKENRGIRRFMRRGIVACASEWKLIAATHNLKKLYRRARPSPRPAEQQPPTRRPRYRRGCRVARLPRQTRPLRAHCRPAALLALHPRHSVRQPQQGDEKPLKSGNGAFRGTAALGKTLENKGFLSSRTQSIPGRDRPRRLFQHPVSWRSLMAPSNRRPART